MSKLVHRTTFDTARVGSRRLSDPRIARLLALASNFAWQMKGGIVLGIGGDNSNSSFGTFFEGAITSGRPTDATDDAVHANVVAAAYGK